VRYRASVAYDGTVYHGFQRQAGSSRTIQGELEAALARIGGSGSVIGAGRTDAGVHASGQVIAFDLEWKHSAGALQKALNVNLPHDIVVTEVQETRPDFHPRYDAISRTYRYRLYVSGVPDPFRRLYAWHLPTPLDVAAMQEAADYLVGTQDFSTFGTPPKGDNPVRTVIGARWITAGDETHFTITANAFLFRMVRRIVGTLIMAGQGQMTAAEFQVILAARNPGMAGAPAPAQGLTLISVDYPDEIE
jgi:tRNA pseudouridine38-40 synthase